MKKISYKEAAFIRNYKRKHYFEKYCCNWYIGKKNATYGYMKLYMKKWVYVILFIPVHVLSLFQCVWDGGIKEMSLCPRMVTYDDVVGFTYNNDTTTSFGRFQKVWNKYYEKN